MARERGEGTLHWDKSRQRWVAVVIIGYDDATGRRLTRKRSSKSKTEAKGLLKEMIRDLDDGISIAPAKYTVKEAMDYWLTYGLKGRSPATVDNYTCLSKTHIVPALGRKTLRDLSVEDVDRWLAREAKRCSTRTLRLLRSLLTRAVKNAMSRDKVKRNVVMLSDVPEGRGGRLSKAFTLAQAEAVLDASQNSRLHAYIVLSLLIGARTEELRALKWEEVDLDGDPDAETPPYIAVYRSDRFGGDTKTEKSRRRLAIPQRCVDALRKHKAQQDEVREKAGKRWKEHGLVFPSTIGTHQNARNVSRDFRDVVNATDLDSKKWTPRELRHSFVSLLSGEAGVPIEDIARLVGHTSTQVTEKVYRHQIVPVLQDGATAMNRLFPEQEEAPEETPGAA